MKKYYVIFCILFYCFHLITNGQDLRFSSLTKEGILDRQSILCITQDQQGRIIFGGQTQLFYFDSYHVNKLNLDDYINKNGIYIEHITTDKNNNLFIGSKQQLFIYDISNKKLFDNGSTPWNAKISILGIEKVEDELFILSTDGVYSVENVQKSYKLTRKLKVDNPRNLVHMFGNNYMLISNKGIHEVIISDQNIDITNTIKFPTAITPITAFFYHSSLWIGTRSEGIFTYNVKNRSWGRINQENSNILSDNIRKIEKDTNENIYIGTLRGLSVLKPNQEIFINYRHQSSDRYSLSQNSIYDILIDNQSNIWIGTYFGGLNYVHQNPYNITTYNASYSYKSKLHSEIISSVAESKDFIWIATEEEGIAKLDKKSHEITNLPKLTKSNLIKDIYIKDDILYIAQIGEGFSIYNIKKNTINHYKFNETHKKYLNDVNRIFVDNNNNIYLCTGRGILATQLDSVSNYYELFPNNLTAVTDIQTDEHNNVYFLIDDILYIKDYNQKTLKPYQPTKGIFIKSFYYENNKLWLVTSNNILKMDSDGRFETIYEFKNKSNAKLIVHHNKLWIARNEGIFCHDLTSKKTNLITQPDGLLVKNLENSRLFLTSEKQIFVPSLNGLMSFFPDQVSFNSRIPNTILEDIRGTEDFPLNIDRLIKIDNHNYELSLKYNENNFTVSFASDNLSKPLKNKFRYKLEGFENNWNETNIPIAKYTELAPGSYTLLILSSNNDDIWSREPLKINIKISPPFWLTWWAYLIYALIALGLLHLVVKFIVERELLLSAEKEHQKKINFFTQISHEIRTPLTLITAPIDEILDATKEDHETSNKVIRLKKNANKLLSIVNELLDFKKIDAGKEAIDPIPVEAKSYLEDIFYLFSDLAVSKQLKFFIDKVEENVYLELDTKHFDKVIYNLLSNAIKYTPQAGEVFLKAYTDKDGRFSIEVCDSGIGVEKDQEFKIFEEYYRDKNAQENIGTGIGLALTKKIVEQHKGSIHCMTTAIHGKQYTSFKISLPPAKTKSVNHITEEKSTQKNEKSHIPDEKELLLIVEDNIELHDVIENIFKEKFTILKAYDGVQGLQYAKDYLPSLIISDVMMPNMDGLEMCELIKNNEKTAHIPIVMLTANTNEETQVKSLKYGSNIYLYKPFNPTILNLTVINLLNLTISKREQFNIDKKELTLSEVDLKFLNKLEKLIDDNLLNENFGVDYIAKDLGMSTPILYKKVKAITNLSVNNFVKTYRFRKAISMMKNGYNISEIAYAVGFSDRKYFSKEFKKFYGVTPSEYEEKNK